LAPTGPAGETFDRAESDIRPRSVPTFGPPTMQGPATDGWLERWPWLVGVVIVLLGAEWVVFARRGLLIATLPPFSLERPQWLLLLLGALPLVVLLARRRLSATSRVMRGAVLAVRLAIVGLLLLALSEPSLHPLGQARSVVFALDASDSLSPEQRQWER